MECKYCEGNEWVYDISGTGVDMHISDDTLNISVTHQNEDEDYIEEGKLEINYCPMCGKKL